MSEDRKELHSGDLLDFSVLVPEEDFGTRKLTFRVAIISDRLSPNPNSKETIAFVDESEKYFLTGVMNTRIDLYALRKFEDFPEYEFMRFLDLISSS